MPTTILDLPADLRARIWNLCIGARSSKPVYPLSAFSTTPALCHVNKQILSESLPIYYASTDFIITISPLFAIHKDLGAVNWLQRMGSAHAKLIRSLYFDFDNGHLSFMRDSDSGYMKVASFTVSFCDKYGNPLVHVQPRVRASISALLAKAFMSPKLLQGIQQFIAYALARCRTLGRCNIGGTATAEGFYCGTARLMGEDKNSLGQALQLWRQQGVTWEMRQKGREQVLEMAKTQ
ncbi:Hypothetical predicted protein [Lecanosticta acicola]|uniref:Uncharacterized protein n=1 Tax=Lecanosticta acicola TaxID=111012 RepID=A0AAI8W1J6_9PEZI|nr:Hypothetical predicted protein [Lecanosticta acicola]